ncbi:MAG: response regulator [Gemmatimonadetes bacterium]|nr:response regulator [Gemmatimonadota bacterium]MBK7785705.1 response regulator [Gemmatimonadota bacterium]MBK7922114.1 response regulator [Gemmatimonadota bacterium]MBK9067170.1 response regulator [Gemmatimonadota bacterium]MBP6668383.1 response regulator [Gemmatimonadales bacterium]
MTPPLPRVLCVDDERHVLEGLGRVLRREFEIVPAVGGAAAVALLQGDHGFDVVLSDMRMPGVDGIAVLGAARRLVPDATRVLLTGHADLRSAIAAVNEGQIFRFLTKPCPPEVLGAALGQAVAQHRLVVSERELLERTLKGSVQALLDVLGLANPVALGRAARARRLIGALATLIGFRDRWQMEMAAMLSQVGAIALPAATAERLAAGARLSPEEEAQVADMPAVALRLIAEIPRLDEIRAILGHVHLRYAGGTAEPLVRGDDIPLGARMLAVVLAYDRLTSGGHAAAEALARLQAHQGWYDPAMLADLATVTGAEAGREILELRLQDVKLGMIFVDDVRTAEGTLLVARGQEVTPGLLGRVENYWSALELPAPVRVTQPEATAPRG